MYREPVIVSKRVKPEDEFLLKFKFVLKGESKIITIMASSQREARMKLRQNGYSGTILKIFSKAV